MKNYIRINAEFSVPEANIDDFKKKAAELVRKVEANEPGALSYEWFLSDDKHACTLVEVYKDSDAVMAHLGNVGALLGPLVEVAPLSRLFILGNPSAEVRQAFAPFGPKILEHWNGVTR